MWADIPALWSNGPKVCPPKVCPLFGNIWISVIIYDKQKAPSIDRAFLQRNMVLFSSRGREIQTPDLLLPKQDGLALNYIYKL
jgi:hypothetical protein|tara:strand:+ start:399 stop:647 length:249 start_codon:yes stop_codon:yes gene_type:complete